MSISTSDILNSLNQVTATSGTTTKSAFDGSDFMLVLLAQLKNQNPLEPMKDNEMMAQMAQLNSLQELTSIKASMDQLAAANSASFAASLVGKFVKATLDDGTNVEGTVSSTSIKDGKYLLNVGDKSIYLASITEISQPPAVALTASTTTDQPAPAPVASSVSKAT
jgi:flagellar basal-body rod modification protein FlgD